MMKKWLMTLLAISLPFIATAWDFCSPCDWCFKLSGGAEALYWKPYTDDFAYGSFLATTTGRTEVLVVEPEYDWGFRIFATVADKCECNFLDFEWIKVQSSNTRSNESAGGTLTQFEFDGDVAVVNTLAARQDNHYQKFSAKLGHRFCGNMCRYLYGYLGGRWLYINVKQSSDGSGTGALAVRQRTSYNGGGVEVGVGGYTDLWCGFGTSLRFGGVSTIGDRSYTNLPGNATIEDSSTRCVAGLDVRADVNYTYHCECFWIRAEIGYEQNYYFSPLVFARGREVSSSYFASDFGMGGLIVGLTVGF